MEKSTGDCDHDYQLNASRKGFACARCGEAERVHPAWRVLHTLRPYPDVSGVKSIDEVSPSALHLGTRRGGAL
jgi:hypothetical protein